MTAELALVKPEMGWSHDFSKDTIIKQPTVRAMYNKARYNYGVIGDVTVLAEEAVERNIMTARQTVACTADTEVKIVEIDKGMHEYQKAVMDNIRNQPRVPLWSSQKYVNGNYEPDQLLPIMHNVHFIHNNIMNVQPTIFIDADLMGTVKTCGPVLQTVLRNQRAAFPIGSPTKGFIFSLAMRNGGVLEEVMDWVLRELIPLTGSTCILGDRESMTVHKDSRRPSNGFKYVGAKKFQFISASHPERLHDVMIHTYSEAGPMITGLIIYS